LAGIVLGGPLSELLPKMPLLVKIKKILNWPRLFYLNPK
jgi:hypothetical protein